MVANAGDGTTRGNVTVFRNVPIDGTFALATLGTFPAGVGARTPVIADFNHDGKKDIIVTNFSSNTVATFRNGGL